MHFGPLFILLMEVVLIIALSRAMGWLFVRIRQPMVIGELMAGILLGPTLFGWVFPEVQKWVFPPANVLHLGMLSNLGVTFFMFIIGLELDLRLLAERGRTSVIVSAASIVGPFALGVAVTYFLRDSLFNQGDSLQLARSAIFMGVAMSAMAFPALARILTERNMHQSRVGTICISAAAVGDLAVWCILAFVVAMGNLSGASRAILTIVGVIAYLAFMFFTLRPFMAKLDEVSIREGKMSQGTFAIIMMLVVASAAIAEMIGVHALLGAFLVGVIMPKRTQFVHSVAGKLEDFVIVLLLPIFFAYTGLRTDLRLIVQHGLWLPTLLLIAVACVGKLGCAGLSARLCGLSWRESGAIGVLLNTRGLIELVILAIGQEQGVINNSTFAAMVVMALVTTAMTSPLLYWIYPTHLLEKVVAPLDQTLARLEYGIVIPVSLPATGPSLARMAALLGLRDGHVCKIYALHLRRSSEQDALRAALVHDPELSTPAPLVPLMETAGELKIQAETVSFISRDVPSDIARVARNKKADLILMGFHNPVFSMSILGGTVHRVLTGSDTDVAIFVDRGLGPIQRVLVPFVGSHHDQLALQCAAQISRRSGAKVRVLHVTDSPAVEGQPLAGVQSIVAHAFEHPSIRTNVELASINPQNAADAVIENAGGFDLILIGVGEHWGLESQLFGIRSEQIAQLVSASLLIVRKAV